MKQICTIRDWRWGNCDAIYVRQTDRNFGGRMNINNNFRILDSKKYTSFAGYCIFKAIATVVNSLLT